MPGSLSGIPPSTRRSPTSSRDPELATKQQGTGTRLRGPLPWSYGDRTEARRGRNQAHMSTDGKPHILAIGGGSFIPNDRYGLTPSPLLRYALDLTGHDRPRVCFLTTAL